MPARNSKRSKKAFAPLVEKCKRRKIAMRIGTNHGSLSDRIMNRYGDTPLGMVESARSNSSASARKYGYHDIISLDEGEQPKGDDPGLPAPRRAHDGGPA